MTDYASRLPAQLSGGQQQRIALARALVSSQKLMLLDEPLCNLDANLREEMRFEIKELQRKNRVTIIYVTHDQDVALAISDRVAVLDNKGNVRQIGRPEEIYRNPADSYVYRFLGLSNFIKLQRKNDRYYVSGSNIAFPYEVPAEMDKNIVYCACRPLNIKLSRTGEFRGTVKRVIFLGNIFEYRIMLGDKEIRIQQDSYDAFNGDVFKEGDVCGIEIEDLKYYSSVEEVE